MAKDAGGHLQLEAHEAAALLPRALSALSRSPNDGDALRAVGCCCNVLGRDDEALEYFRRAAQTPHPMNWYNYCNILRQCGRQEEAWPYLWNAHRVWPDDAKIGLTYVEELLRNGNYEKALPLFKKYRFSKDWVQVTNLREWDGDEIRGKHVLVVGEGGLGDMIWLFRLLPEVTKLGADVSVGFPESLGQFFDGHPYLSQGEPRAFDCWISIFDLLTLLEIREPYWSGPYVHAKNPVQLDTKRVGICWASSEQEEVRKYRSMTDSQVASLMETAGIRWASLQQGMCAPIECLELPLTSWDDTVNLMASLDLIVTVDTSVAHMAGAMGKKTWLVLSGYQSYIYGTGETCGWYPNTRIFRNRGFGFDEVLPRVRQELSSFSERPGL